MELKKVKMDKELFSTQIYKDAFAFALKTYIVSVALEVINSLSHHSINYNESLKDSNPYLAKKLQDKIDNYKVEKGDNFLVFYSDDKVAKYISIIYESLK